MPEVAWVKVEIIFLSEDLPTTAIIYSTSYERYFFDYEPRVPNKRLA